MKMPRKTLNLTGKVLTGTLVCLSMAIVLFGVHHYETQKQEIEQTARDALMAVANLKVAQIQQWRQELLGDAEWGLHGSTLGNDVGKLLVNPIDARARNRRTLWIVAWQQYQECSRVLLLDTTGKVLLAVPEGKDEVEPLAQEFIARTLKEQQLLVSDLHLKASTPNTEHMDVIIPLFDRSDMDVAEKIVGVLMMEIDPHVFLFPMIEAWPTPSKTAETLLVRRDGDEVLFLNELRHRKGTALKLTFPLANRQIPAVQAVLGKEGVVEGIDYRGVPVLAALRKIPNSPWFIVSKQDQAEIFGPVRQHMWTTGVAVASLLLAILSSFVAFWRRRELLFTQQELVAHEKADVALRESEERFKFFFEHSNIGESITQLSGKLEANQAFCNLLGYSQSELNQRSWQDVTHPDDLNVTQCALDALLSRKQDSTRITKRFLHKNGSVVWMELCTTLRRNAAGQPIYFMTAALDITERLRLEEQLLQSQKMDAVGQLASGVAHDFNNLLTIVQFETAILTQNPTLDAESREGVALIAKTADRAANLTRQLLSFSRKEAKEVRPIDLPALVEDMARLLHRMLGEDIELTVHTSRNLPSLLADPGMIEQVLMNLAVNSRDAMPNGGELDISVNMVELDARAISQHSEAQPGKFFQLTVRDTGTGISPAHLSRIFEPFFTTKEAGKGTGLGLATAFGIVKQHNGWIEVASELDRGTTFTIFLPIAVAAAGKQADVLQPAALKGGTETILVAEDEYSVRHLMQISLERYGYRVLIAANGAEATERMIESGTNVDLLITDLVMPGGVNGKELAQKLQKLCVGLKVIYISGHTSDNLSRGLKLEPGVNFLRKPFSIYVLVELVRHSLDRGKDNAQSNQTAEAGSAASSPAISR